MLAVTAGDGACGENSTQPTARVSQVAFGLPDTGAGAHHSTSPASVRPSLPRLSLCVTPKDVDRARALNDGVVCSLRNPVDEQHLIRCLRAALESGEPGEGNS